MTFFWIGITPPSILRSSESGLSSVLLSPGIVSPPKRNVSFDSSLSQSSCSSSVTLLGEKVREQQRVSQGVVCIVG